MGAGEPMDAPLPVASVMLEPLGDPATACPVADCDFNCVASGGAGLTATEEGEPPVVVGSAAACECDVLAGRMTADGLSLIAGDWRLDADIVANAIAYTYTPVPGCTG
eukprot:1430033-Rhodomonas_salina.1